MAFNWNRFAYTNFHELNLDWFNEHFKEIFEEWENLYNTLTEWKVDTDRDLAEWKHDTLQAMDEWENNLIDALDTWKRETGADINEWETGIISDLNDWKQNFNDAFDLMYNRVDAIVSDTEDMIENLAEPFSTSVSYTTGDYVIYNGVLYVFTTNHAAGAWNGSDAIQTTAMSDYKKIKTNMDNNNSVELLETYGTRTNRTTAGNVTFEWDNKNKCIINGSAVAPQTFNNIYGMQSSLYPGFIPGNIYVIKIEKSNDNIWLELVEKIGNTSVITQLKESCLYTLNSNAVGATLRLNTLGGVTYTNDYIITHVYTSFSNEQLTNILANNKEIIVDKIGAMLNVAETHFNEAYKPGSHLVYQQKHGTGIFYANPYYIYDGEEWGDVAAYAGLPCTQCAQFVSTLMKGVRYETSRYISGANGVNQFSQWAWFSDDKYEIDYHTPGTIDDYMDCKEMADYANKHGFLQTMNIDKPNVAAGDIVFWKTSAPGPLDSIADIGHCAMVLQVGMDSKNIEIIEAWNATKPDGSGVGIRTRTVNMADIAFYATFPFKDAPHIYKVIYNNENNTVITPDNNHQIWVNDYSKLGKPEKGFYTFIMQGEFDESSLPYIRYQTDATHLTPNHYFVRSANSYICTIYISEEIQNIHVSGIKIYYDLNESCIIDKLFVVKGYLNIDANII